MLATSHSNSQKRVSISIAAKGHSISAEATRRNEILDLMGARESTSKRGRKTRIEPIHQIVEKKETDRLAIAGTFLLLIQPDLESTSYLELLREIGQT